MLDWSNEAAAKVRETYPDPRTAFTAFYGRSVRERLAGLKDILPSLDMDDSTLSRSLYRSYATGMSDASLAHRVEVIVCCTCYDSALDGGPSGPLARACQAHTLALAS